MWAGTWGYVGLQVMEWGRLPKNTLVKLRGKDAEVCTECNCRIWLKQGAHEQDGLWAKDQVVGVATQVSLFWYRYGMVAEACGNLLLLLHVSAVLRCNVPLRRSPFDQTLSVPG